MSFPTRSGIHQWLAIFRVVIFITRFYNYIVLPCKEPAPYCDTGEEQRRIWRLRNRKQFCLTATKQGTHKPLGGSSNLPATTIEAKFSQNSSNSFQRSQVLPEASELLQLRELIYILLGNKGRRHLELRQKTKRLILKQYMI